MFQYDAKIYVHIAYLTENIYVQSSTTDVLKMHTTNYCRCIL